MQLFIYLFIPIVKSLNENHFSNLTLSNSSKIWEPLWRHVAPDIPLFNNPINSKVYKAIESNESTEALLQSSIDESKEKISKDETKIIENLEVKPKNSDSINIVNACNYLENLHENEKSVSTVESNHDSFLFFTADFEDRDYRNGNNIRLSHLLIKTVGDDIINDVEEFSRKAPLVHMSSICSFIDLPSTQTASPVLLSKKPSLNENDNQRVPFKLDNEKSIQDNKDLNDSRLICKKNNKDATFFDIALIRCIFNSKWHPDGYIWSLEYLYNRVTKIADEINKDQENYAKIKTTSISLPNLNQNFSKYKIRNNKKGKSDILRNAFEAKKSQKCELGFTFVFDNWIR